MNTSGRVLGLAPLEPVGLDPVNQAGILVPSFDRDREDATLRSPKTPLHICHDDIHHHVCSAGQPYSLGGHSAFVLPMDGAGPISAGPRVNRLVCWERGGKLYAMTIEDAFGKYTR